METTPAVDYFSAYTVELYPDVRDGVAHTITDIRSGEGSTVRFYNSAEEEFVKLRTDRVSKRFQPSFDGKLRGVRHAEDGRLYAIPADPDEATHEEPVDVFPFADVQAGPAAATVSSTAPFAETVRAARPYADSEMDGLL